MTKRMDRLPLLCPSSYAMEMKVGTPMLCMLWATHSSGKGSSLLSGGSMMKVEVDLPWQQTLAQKSFAAFFFPYGLKKLIVVDVAW